MNSPPSLTQPCPAPAGRCQKWISYRFTGTGVDYISSWNSQYGDADITIPDASGRIVKQQTVSAAGGGVFPAALLRRLPNGRATERGV